MPTPEEFEQHFLQRADLAEQLYRDGWRNEAHLVASVALDSLGRVWAHDLPKEAPRSGDAVRFRAFVQKYARDPKTSNVAVVLFAQDLYQYGSSDFRDLATRMLDQRNAITGPDKGMEFREWPHQHKDCTWGALLLEEPDLAKDPKLKKQAERYTYPALVYSLFRCGVAHTLLRGSRTHDFSGVEPDGEISYSPPMLLGGRTRPIGIKFGLRVTTGWIRACASNYRATCDERGILPANKFDPSDKSLAILKKSWVKMAQTR